MIPAHCSGLLTQRLTGSITSIPPLVPSQLTDYTAVARSGRQKRRDWEGGWP